MHLCYPTILSILQSDKHVILIVSSCKNTPWQPGKGVILADFLLEFRLEVEPFPPFTKAVPRLEPFFCHARFRSVLGLRPRRCKYS
jgi:hypothetical protein